jgi:cell wall assembly regulator SMI1
MNQTLLAFEQWLKTNYRAAYGSLQPGLSDEQISAQLSDWPYTLPDDVRALYRWRNGFEDENVELLPGLTFRPLESALAMAAAYWEVSAQQVEKGGPDFFPKLLLPIFSDADGDLVLLVQGAETSVPSSPAQVIRMTQGQRLYGFERLSELLAAALELFQNGTYAVDEDRDTVSITDEGKAQAVWRKYPLLYLENVDVTPLALENAEPVDDSDDEEDGDDGDMLAGLLDMLGIDPQAVDPETATLEDLTELREIIPYDGWPDELKERYRQVSVKTLEAGEQAGNTGGDGER